MPVRDLREILCRHADLFLLSAPPIWLAAVMAGASATRRCPGLAGAAEVARHDPVRHRRGAVAARRTAAISPTRSSSPAAVFMTRS